MCWPHLPFGPAFDGPVHRAFLLFLSPIRHMSIVHILPSLDYSLLFYPFQAIPMTNRVWQNGPAVPLTTPFLADDLNSVDHAALAKQVVRCAKAGLGIVLLGTTGEGQWSWYLSLAN